MSHKLSRFSKKETNQFFSKAYAVARKETVTVLVAPAIESFGRILVVTPRAIGNSPQRNRVRRRLKAIFFENKLFERGYDCAVIVRKKGVDLSFDELKEILLTGFSDLDQARNGNDVHQ